MSQLAQMLLLTVGTDLGCRIFVVANEKFISIFVRVFRKSDAQGITFVNLAVDSRIVMQREA